MYYSSIIFFFLICFTINFTYSDLIEKKNILPKKINLENIIEKKENEEKIKNDENLSENNKFFKNKLKIITAAQVEEINKSNKKWKAKIHSRFADKTPEELNHFLGVKKPINKEKLLKRNKRNNNIKELNEYKEFDSRNEWPECKNVINIIQDQSACGSCWAVSSASVMQDRICISSGGEIKVNISSEDILSCEKQSFGCEGGWPENAFNFWKTKGVCTGSDYLDHEGCKPYPFPPNPDTYLYNTPRCKRRCENRNYKTKYNKDKYYGMEPTNLQESEEIDIMNAIIEGGPVEADMVVYYDFFHYSEGVYEVGKYSSEAGGHAVRIIGWGHHNESNTPYWLVANSWGNEWGMDGYFKIARGQDECLIESWGINFADPLISNNTLTNPGTLRASKRRQEKIEKRQKLKNH